MIWNRALQEDASDLRDGDRALAAMVIAHGYVMSGDVLQTVEILDDHGDFDDAVDAFNFFGRRDIAELLIEARAYYLGDEFRDDDEYFNARYHALLPDDDDLTARFEAMLQSNPSAFAPLPDQ